MLMLAALATAERLTAASPTLPPPPHALSANASRLCQKVRRDTAKVKLSVLV
ncbi:hypothetical protein AB3X96_40995 [Paraburkholderia sp. BR13439]|uniref:hypothetical protein n=1 Tax=unclassified Paraburkholderia TaxID=2615204 RepID=UPI0034CEBBEE